MMQSIIDAFHNVIIAAARDDSESLKRALGALIHACNLWLDELHNDA